MSVNNGQPVEASVVNVRFVSRTVNTSTAGVLALQNTTDVNSGAAVPNIQQAANETFDAVGMTGIGDANRNNYISNELVTDGDNRKEAIEALDMAFNAASGHTHDGTPGSGGPLVVASATSSGIVSTGSQSFAGNKTFLNDLFLSASLSGAVTSDATTTGSNAVLPTPLTTVTRITNAGLVSISDITAPTGSLFFVLLNKTGNSISLVNSNASSTDILTGTGSALTVSNNASVWLLYTGSRWNVVGGSGGGGAVAYQETPPGVVNGVNGTFGPLSFLPSSANSVLVSIDGISIPITTGFSVTGSTITIQPGYIPQLGQSVYAYYLTGGSPAIPVLSGTYRVEYRTISAGEALAKQLTMAFTPGTPSYVSLDLIGGSSQFFGADFTVVGNGLSWLGLGLDGFIFAGDKFRIVYVE